MQNDLMNRVNRISRHPVVEGMSEEKRNYYMGELAEDCIHGICTGVKCDNCGLCSKNQNIKDRLKKLLAHFKYELKHIKAEECMNDATDLRRIQRENKFAAIRYHKKKIRECQILLKELEKVV